MGSEIIEGARLSYPGLIQVHRFDSKTLTSQRVAVLLEDVGYFRVIICGPVGLNSRVADMMAEFGGRWPQSMRILSSDRPN